MNTAVIHTVIWRQTVITRDKLRTSLTTRVGRLWYKTSTDCDHYLAFAEGGPNFKSDFL